VPSLVGESVHQSLALASALGYGGKYVPSLVEAQEQLTGRRSSGVEDSEGEAADDA